jgi:predicted Rossmann fold nucleotide-binding protein DprA/Smf involved in DNA uptake
LAVSAIGEFSFDPLLMSYNTTYYVSSVVFNGSVFNISVLEEKIQMQIYSSDEKKIIDHLHQALNFDELLKKTKMEYLNLMTILLNLESKGLIQKRGAYYYH